MSNPMFKPHDVRGKHGTEITEADFYRLGAACLKAFELHLLTGRDYRTGHGPLESAFIEGFRNAGGIDYGSLGVVPSPVIAHSNKGLGVAFTASHNPAGYCGAKFFTGNTFATEAQVTEVAESFDEAPLMPSPSRRFDAVSPAEDAGEKIGAYEDCLPPMGPGIFDLAGGAACMMKGMFTSRIFDSPDPEFKLHDAEPKDSTLGVLKEKTITDRAIGYAFDGDADRVIAVDSGKAVEGHVLACAIAQETLKKNDAVVLSIDCPSEAFTWLKDAGFTTHCSKVGDVNVIEKALGVGAKLGAERSGHYTFPPHYPYADGIRAAAIASGFARKGDLLEIAGQFKNVTLIEAVFFKADFAKLAELAGGEKGVQQVLELDGVKAGFDEFSILIRQSNTEPKIRINSEARNPQLAGKGMRLAKTWLQSAKLSGS